MRTADVADFVADCIQEAEADGYQQQEGNLVHMHGGIAWGWVTATEMWFKTGGEEFRCAFRKVRNPK